MNLSSQVCRLHQLHAAGVLDDREFARAKHALLHQHTARRANPRHGAIGRGLRLLRNAAAAATMLAAGAWIVLL